MLRKAMKTTGDALSVFHHVVVYNRLRSWPSCNHIAMCTFMCCHNWHKCDEKQTNHFCDGLAMY